MNIIGIDGGSSLIKIIEVNEKRQITNSMLREKTKIEDALKEFIKIKNINLGNIEKIILTGVGTGEINQKLYNIETIKVDEFIAIGTGGTLLANKKEALVISVGTGTAFVKVEENKITHIGGTGIGGGTFLNLCKALTKINDIKEIKEKVSKGNLRNVNLTIQDVSTKEIKTLPNDITAVNFGKLKGKEKKEDIILGILNMIIEVIGMMAAFTVKNQKNKEVVLTGNIITFPKVKEFLKRIEEIQEVKFIIPNNAEFATILGAIHKKGN